MTRPGQGWVASGRTTITDLHLVEVRWSRVPAPAACHLPRLQSTRGTWLQCCSAAVPLQSGHRDKFKAFLGTPARARVGASCRRPPHFCVCMQTAGWRLQRLWSAAALWCLTAAGFTPHHTAPTAFSRYCWVNWCETYLYTHHRNFILSCIYIFCIYLDYKINVVFYFRILWGEMEGEGDLTFIC